MNEIKIKQRTMHNLNVLFDTCTIWLIIIQYLPFGHKMFLIHCATNNNALFCVIREF